MLVSLDWKKPTLESPSTKEDYNATDTIDFHADDLYQL